MFACEMQLHFFRSMLKKWRAKNYNCAKSAYCDFEEILIFVLIRLFGNPRICIEICDVINVTVRYHSKRMTAQSPPSF